MRRNGFTLVEMAVVLFFVLVIAAIMLPVIGRAMYPERGVRRSFCQSNLKVISLAISNYMQDSERKFPLVGSGKKGWTDSIAPYLKYTWRLQCTSEVNPEKVGTTDYFYNSRLAGGEEGKLALPKQTLMNGAGNAPRNVSLSQFPPAWVSNQQSPAWRHLEGANYAYADGHVKWLKASKMLDTKPSQAVNTFAPW